MAAGRGRGGASRAGSNHPARACASAALSLSREGLLVVHLCRMFRACMVAQRGFGYPLLVWALELPHRPRVRFFNSGSK